MSSSPRGIAAITPTIHAIPAFTEGDVRLYFQSNSFPTGPTVSGGPPTVESVRFMTSGEARVILKGEFIGVPDSAMVCYVELRGPFSTVLISVPPGQPLPPTVDRGYVVFDAQTGNLLLSGLR